MAGQQRGKVQANRYTRRFSRRGRSLLEGGIVWLLGTAAAYAAAGGVPGIPEAFGLNTGWLGELFSLPSWSRMLGFDARIAFAASAGFAGLLLLLAAGNFLAHRKQGAEPAPTTSGPASHGVGVSSQAAPTVSRPTRQEPAAGYWDCPSCGRKLTVRKGPHGKFIGCTGYPRCRYTRPTDKTAAREAVRSAVSTAAAKAGPRIAPNPPAEKRTVPPTVAMPPRTTLPHRQAAAPSPVPRPVPPSGSARPGPARVSGPQAAEPPKTPEEPVRPEPPRHWSPPGLAVPGVWGFPSTSGERRLAEIVAAALAPYPEARILANGLWEHPVEDWSVQVDLLVLLDAKLLAFEHKHLSESVFSLAMNGMGEWVDFRPSKDEPGSRDSRPFQSPLAQNAGHLEGLAAFLVPLRNPSRSLSMVVLPDHLDGLLLATAGGGTRSCSLPWRLTETECSWQSLVLLEKHVAAVVGGAAERWGAGTAEERAVTEWCWRWLLANDHSGSAAARERHEHRCGRADMERKLRRK